MKVTPQALRKAASIMRAIGNGNKASMFDAAADEIEQLTARLAADQQKSGGGVVSHEMLDKAEADLNAKDEFGNLYVSEETYRYATALIGWMRDRTPQPSIPAPAQQGDQLDAARWRKLEELVDTGSDRYWYVHPSDGEGGSYDRMKSASHLRQCIDRELAHPPHADQETQG